MRGRPRDLTCPCSFSVKVRRQELSQSAEDWDVNGTCTDATCGFRSESLHQHLTVQKGGTAKNPPDSLTKAAGSETLERHRKRIGLRRVKAHSSQNELRLQSLVANAVSVSKQTQYFAICGEPADMPWHC